MLLKQSVLEPVAAKRHLKSTCLHLQTCFVPSGAVNKEMRDEVLLIFLLYLNLVWPFFRCLLRPHAVMMSDLQTALSEESQQDLI